MSYSQVSHYTKIREDRFEEITSKFYDWYLSQYKTRPICLFINLMNLENWDLFLPENENDLIETLRQEGYLEYFPVLEISGCVKVLRKYLDSV